MFHNSCRVVNFVSTSVQDRVVDYRASSSIGSTCVHEESVTSPLLGLSNGVQYSTVEYNSAIDCSTVQYHSGVYQAEGGAPLCREPLECLVGWRLLTSMVSLVSVLGWRLIGFQILYCTVQQRRLPTSPSPPYHEFLAGCLSASRPTLPLQPGIWWHGLTFLRFLRQPASTVR